MTAIIARTILLLAAVALFSSCARLNCTSLESLLGAETDLIKFSYRIADNLTEQALPPLQPRNPQMPVLVTTFVDNNDLRQTSQFGRTMQEHIASRLVQLGYAVKEIKLANSMTIEEKSGETLLSRELRKLSGSQQAQAVLVGTVSYTERTMYISTRLINPISADIIASDDYRLCMDDHILAMFGLQRGHGDELIAEPRQPFRIPF
jgi:TolB-like protein